MPDVLGQAIYDYYFNLSPAKLLIHNKFGKPDEMPVEVYFREDDEMPEMELKALEECRGKVLDIGAGAGSHALYLQEQSINVSAMELSPLACTVMTKRGVQNIINQNIFDYKGARYDTLLMLMNGIGLSANIAGLRTFLQHAKTLLAPGGQMLFDSSDVTYLYKKKQIPTDKYYGEIDFRYEYKNQKTSWFTWLYIDQEKLNSIAAEEGWKIELLVEDDHDQYLVRLTPNP